MKAELTVLVLVAMAAAVFAGNNAYSAQARGARAGNTDGAVTDVPAGVKVIPDIAYREGPSQAWRLDLAMPEQPSDEPRPAIVFVHGGGWRSGDKRAANFLRPTLEFAAKGYVCITVNYRLLNETSISGCVEDVKCAVRWLRAHAGEYGVDPERIGAYGNSAGAHLVSMLGLCPPSAGLEGDGPWQEYSSMVQAVVASATPTNFMVPINDRMRKLRSDRTSNQQPSDSQRSAAAGVLGGMSEEMRKKISPMTYVNADAPPFLLVHEESDRTVGVHQSDDFVNALREAGAKDDPPFLIMHGDKDLAVPLHQSELLLAALKKAGVEASLYVVKGGGHGLGGGRESPQELFGMAADFFDKHLKKPKAQAASANRGAARNRPRLRQPTYSDVKYGPHEQSAIDFYKAESDEPTPVAVFIHGGGFRNGSKRGVNAGTLQELLDAGISVAAVEYRFISHAPLPAAHHDSLRALQFIRSKAGAWNIDKKRIGAFGGSAGAQICMWLAFHDEMADPSSSDPVERESSRLTCVATTGGQTTMDFDWWMKWIPSYDKPHRDRVESFGEITDEELRNIIDDISALSIISADDVPIFMSYGMKPDDPVPADDTRAQGWKVHHVTFGIKLKEKMDELGLEADLKYPGARTTYQSQADFFIKKLKAKNTQ